MDYKSLCVAVMMYDMCLRWLTSTHTHTDRNTDRRTDRQLLTAYTISSTSQAELKIIVDAQVLVVLNEPVKLILYNVFIILVVKLIANSIIFIQLSVSVSVTIEFQLSEKLLILISVSINWFHAFQLLILSTVIKTLLERKVTRSVIQSIKSYG